MFKGLQGYTRVYRGIQGFTGVYKGIQGFTGVFKGLLRVKKGLFRYTTSIIHEVPTKERSGDSGTTT